jgi:hypothetical protein
VLKWLDQLASWGDCFLGTTISKAALQPRSDTIIGDDPRERLGYLQ